MKKSIEERVYSAQSYLDDIVNENISDSQDVQRDFCSKNDFVNEIIMTVLTDDYMPSLIIGEIHKGNIIERYLVDGMQRTTAMRKFKYEGYKVGKVEEPIITYQVKKKDENGVIVRDDEGNPVWETAEFDITKKGYDDLPPELKKDFDNFQIKIAAHKDCKSMKDISALIRKYNRNTPMNANQKSFTYLDVYARKVKTIAASDFFKESSGLKGEQEKKGLWTNMVMRSMMTVFHMDNYKKAAKDLAVFLNTNASDSEFDEFQDIANKFSDACGDAYKDLFIPKNIPVWFAAFDHFLKTKPGDMEVSKFRKFLDSFKESLHSKAVDIELKETKSKRAEIEGEITWDKLDEMSGTTDVRIVKGKIDVLCKLIDDFYGVKCDPVETIVEPQNTISEPSNDKETELSRAENSDSKVAEENDNDVVDDGILKFVQENVREDIDQEDIDLYKDFLGDYVRDDAPVYKAGEDAVVALMAYASDIEKDGEFGEWLDKENAKENHTYSPDHRVNFTYMKRDFDRYCAVMEGLEENDNADESVENGKENKVA